jgi:N-acetylmuramoyl-L-alanine amidase
MLAAAAVSPAAATTDSTSSIVVAGRTASAAVEPYRSGDAICASVDFVQAMGATYRVTPDGNSVAVSDGDRTCVLPCKTVSGQPVVSVGQTAAALGGVLQWDEASRTANILARVKMVREDSDRLTVATGFPVSYRVGSAEKPNRVYVDVYDASLGAPSATVPVLGDDVASVRANQLNPTTVRVVVNLKQPLGYRVVSANGAPRVQIALSTSLPDNDDAYHPVGPAIPRLADSVAPSVDSRGDGISGRGGDNDTPGSGSAVDADSRPVDLTSAAATEHIVDIETDSSTANELRATVTVNGPGAQSAQPYRAFLLDSPDRLVVDLPGADYSLTGSLAANTDCKVPLTAPVGIKSLRWGLLDGSKTKPVGRLVFDLDHPVSYTVSSSNLPGGAESYTVDLVMTPPAPAPTEADQTPAPASPDNGGVTVAPVITPALPNVPNTVLSGKIVVVDPGHGGKDGGAPGVNGLWEKDITLAVGKLLRDQLLACGAKVIMTRADDTFIPLPDRSQMGIDNHADFFVSIHADSSGGQNSHEGSTVYYHANVADCRQLAQSISQRLAQLNDGVEALGTRSDYVRFPGVGFSVLRRSPEPAVLVETGYVNSDHDAEVLTDPAMQKLIAEGIVAGLKDFALAQPGSKPAVTTPSGSDGGSLAMTRKGP